MLKITLSILLLSSTIIAQNLSDDELISKGQEVIISDSLNEEDKQINLINEEIKNKDIKKMNESIDISVNEPKINIPKNQKKLDPYPTDKSKFISLNPRICTQNYETVQKLNPKTNECITLHLNNGCIISDFKAGKFEESNWENCKK